MIKKDHALQKKLQLQISKDRNLLIHEIINTRLLVFREKNNKEDLKKRNPFN